MDLLKQLPSHTRKKKSWPWIEGLLEPSRNIANDISWPKISIITPSYNQGNFIEETIRSVLLQNYPNLEYIIMDGGSQDQSIEIIKKYEDWLSFWSSKKDEGQYDAINKGFERSTGEIMLWINSDDMLVENTLFAIAEIFSQSQGDVQWITGIPAYWDSQNNLYRIFQPIPYHRFFMKMGCYEGRAINWVMQECTVWSRTLWEKAGSYVDTSLDYASDFELWFRFGRYADLYNVSTLIGANRQWSGQKTVAEEKYYKDVDTVINKNWKSAIVNRLCRFHYIKKIIRAYFLVLVKKNIINYNSRTMLWEIIK